MAVRKLTHYDSNTTNLCQYDTIVVGAGFAGAVIARELAERSNRKVAIIEKRAHLGGNTYDEYDNSGVLVHRYGPHIFHSNDTRVYNYLSRFCKWFDYQHQVLANIHGSLTPVPFNLNSIEQHFNAQQAQAIIEKLVTTFGVNAKVPIISLRAENDPLLASLADFVYENVFLHYTEKQWGQTPEQIDPSVTARVPVLVGRDNRYFQDKHQGMPGNGYTALFENLLDHPNICCYLNCDAREVLSFTGSDSIQHNNADAAYTGILADGQAFTGDLIYTGPLDLLNNCCFGLLPYRSLRFVFKTVQQKHVLPCGTVNYTVSEDYTRISEYTWMTGQDLPHTTIMEEYPLAFSDPESQVPYYAIINEENSQRYQRYLDLFARLPGFHVLGRLAEYRYYNMDQIVARALDLADALCG